MLEKAKKILASSDEEHFLPPSYFHLQREIIMSQHNSFKASAASGTSKRTVLKRFERLDLLKKRGQWKGQRLSGLPKTKPDV
jgi:small basic protein (TIGR04137 family)